MFRELVELGAELEGKKQLPPPGFYEYREPIKWVVHLWQDRVYIEETKESDNIPRPFCGRTSHIEAHLLTDEAGYAIGVNKGQRPRKNKTAKQITIEKHNEFNALVKKFYNSDILQDNNLVKAIDLIESSLAEKKIEKDPNYRNIESKDWVSFMPEEGDLKGKHLFEHSEAKVFWIAEMQERSRPGDEKKYRVIGECSVCGKPVGLVGKISLGVKLAGNAPLHSLNYDAFVSYYSGKEVSKKSHLGLCFECGDTASRAFNYLSNSPQHRRDIVKAKRNEDRDKLVNQTAFLWLKTPSPIMAGDTVVDLNDIKSFDFGAVINENKNAPAATLSQLMNLLVLPWKPRDTTVNLNDYGFYLAILSPNVGRIILRDWYSLSIAKIKGTLLSFLKATRMVSYSGIVTRPQSIGKMIEALDSHNPNITRILLGTAFRGTNMALPLYTIAFHKLSNLIVNEAALRERHRNRKNRYENIWDDAWPEALASIIKLNLYYNTKEAETMCELNEQHKTPAYLCGRLLAVLEEAQQVATFIKSHKRLDTTIVNRYYGGASTAPAATYGVLLSLATKSHLPEAGKDINELNESVIAALDLAGGFPKMLNLAEKAEFGLGFYHQRADFNKKRADKKQANKGEEK